MRDSVKKTIWTTFWAVTSILNLASLIFAFVWNDQLREEKWDLWTKNVKLDIQVTDLTATNARLEARLVPQPEPTTLPADCPMHSEPVPQDDGSWLVLCIDRFGQTKGSLAKAVYIFQTNPAASGGWTAIDDLPFRATITAAPLNDPSPPCH